MPHEQKTVPFEPKSEYDFQALRIAKAFKDESSVPKYRALFDKYEDRWIIAIFERVRDLPDERIKKSRPALFFYLMKRYGRPTGAPKRSGNAG